ncbi:MAG: DUF2007 domain-containing protein [Chitinivibrionales bacterium]|nr:DUF2007 domain-containing protein [Chitinivibrionales bacterium]
MVELFSSPSSVDIAVVKGYLEAAGIECDILDNGLNSIMGEIPFTETWHKLYLRNDNQLAEAQALLQEYLAKQREPAESTFCPECDSEEVVELKPSTPLSFSMMECRACKHRWKVR